MGCAFLSLLYAVLVWPALSTVEDISYLDDYDLYAEGSRTCLNNSIPYANRANLTFGTLSTPVKIWQFTWPTGMALCEVVKIVIQERLGFHAVTIPASAASNSAYTALMDCYNPDDVSQPCRVQQRGSRAHLSFEVWSNYDVAMLSKAETEGNMDAWPIRVGYPGTIGYDGVEGMFVGSASYDASGAANPPLPLRWYESYNSSWSDPIAYFTDYADLPHPSQSCLSMAILTTGGGLNDYIATTGWNVPTEMVGSVEVAKCYDNWFPSPACLSRSRVGCIPVLTTGGYSVFEILQWTYWHNFATMFGSYNWGDYVNVASTNRTLCYWWLPDVTLAGLGLTPIRFPAEDRDEQALGIIRTEKPGTDIWKMMSNVVAASEPLIETFMERFEISMGSMMQIAENYNPNDPWQTACDFLQQYPERWAVWEPDMIACILGQGLQTGANGEQACAWCPFGTFSAQHPTIARSRICTSCPLGQYQGAPGQTECQTCLAGYYSASAGQSSCDACPLGSYTNASGMATCQSCGAGKADPEFWSTMQELPTATGTRISYINGATDASFCTCDVDRRFEGDECVACSLELECAGMGNVQVLPGFAALNGDVNRIFECLVDQRWCPGGDAGVCAEGRQGVQCGECKPGYTPGENGMCAPCGGSDSMPFIIVVCCFFLVLCGMYHGMARAKYGKGKSPLTMMLMVTTGGQIIAFVQMTGTFSSFSVDWGEPFNSFLAIAKIITSFNFDVIRLSCVATLRPLITYISRVSIIGISLVAILFIFTIHTIVLDKCEWRRMGKKLIICLGALSMSLFISVVAAITAPLQCVKHPCGDMTVRTFPTVLCTGFSGDYGTMVIVALAVSTAPLALLALVVWVNFNFASRMQAVDNTFFELTGFLFVCYRVETYWYCVATWFRNLLVALVPILPNVVAQITMFNLLLLTMLIVVSRFLPWRAKIGNVLDMAVYSSVICINGFAIGFAEPDNKLMAYIAMVFICIGLGVFILAACYGLARMCIGARKQFEFFVSHHKAVTGAFARLLKMMILECRPDVAVFLDSDNLTNLDVLFDTVATGVENIVMVTSAEFLKRPWCIGELSIAHIRKVKVYPLYCSDFKPPDDDFITNYTSYVPDMKTLTENNITLDSVQAGLKWFCELPYISLPDRLFNGDLDKLVKNILACNMQDLAGTAASKHYAAPRLDSRIMIAADGSVFQAAMASRVLGRLLNRHARLEADSMDMSKNLPEIFADTGVDGTPAQLTTSTSVMVLVLSNGCFTSPTIISTLHQAAEVKVILLPVVADDSFRFPNAAFYEQLHRDVMDASVGSRSDAQKSGGSIVSGVFSMFKRIAPLFEPNASIGLLDAQSYEVYKKIKAVSNIDRAPDTDWTKWSPGAIRKSLQEEQIGTSGLEEDQNVVAVESVLNDEEVLTANFINQTQMV